MRAFLSGELKLVKAGSMWRSWSKSFSPRKPDKFTETSSSSSPSASSSIFRCSSFKDIENLCLDPDSLPSSSTSNHHHHHHPQHQQQHPSFHSQTKHHHLPQPTTPRRSIFHRVRTANALLRQWPGRSESLQPPTKTKSLPLPEPEPEPETEPQVLSEEARIVFYYTSLRVVRSTFEACRSVQSILQGFRVAIDERDVTMDSSFMSELRERLGLKPNEKLGLPRVFIGGRYVGGADEVMHLNEIGELKKLVQGLPPSNPGTCDTCGGYRFILCAECSGSHKIFSDKLGFRSCTACNENGLIRCPLCSSPSPCPTILRNAHGSPS